MVKNKFLPSIIYLIVLTVLISVVLISFQFRFLITSFKINSKGHKVPIITLFPDTEPPSPLRKTARVSLKLKIFEDPGYSLSFFIKTFNQSQKETILFYSTDEHLSSIYWNVSLIDGKIETARIEHIPPMITDQKINDNNWHHILVTANYNEERIYIDNKLSKRTSVNYLKTPDKWFVVDINEKLVGDDKIHLKDFIFINRDLTPQQFGVYQNYFLGETIPLYRSTFFTLIKNLLIIVSFYVLLIFIIKSNYPNKNAFSIIKFLSPKLSFFLLAAISLWTGYGYEISLLCFFVFFYYVLQNYKNIFPAFLRTFVNLPISFLLRSLKLLRKVKIKELFLYATSQKPEVYFCLFLFLGLLLSFNRFLFTNNLFR